MAAKPKIIWAPTWPIRNTIHFRYYLRPIPRPTYEMQVFWKGSEKWRPLYAATLCSMKFLELASDDNDLSGKLPTNLHNNYV